MLPTPVRPTSATIATAPPIILTNLLRTPQRLFLGVYCNKHRAKGIAINTEIIIIIQTYNIYYVLGFGPSSMQHVQEGAALDHACLQEELVL